ncbi:MAG: ribosome small subunit-dependent GTPase A [Clostridia bacterium]|nr:ribosome small subunit-dependent GTPase A [Clostridia bacterium]
MTGIITASSGGLYTVETGEGSVQCRARGVFRHKHEKVVVGDRVELTQDGEGTVISAICERKNVLIRPPMANLDYIFVTAAASMPSPDPFMLDKLTTIAEYNKIKPVIIIGKCELDRERAAELCGIYRLAGYDAFCVSCHEGEGIDAVKKYIDGLPAGSISAFAGASGVGKSSLMNLLFPGLSLETSSVSHKTERGRHTTRSVTLYPSGAGYIADTPGFSMLDFEHFDFFTKDDLPDTFPEFADLLGTCKYTKCSHTKEDGCAILAAVRAGKIARSRHDSYLALYEILKNKHAWDK